MTLPKTKLGDLNGVWALLVRVVLATYPFILMWAIWITAQQFKDMAFRDSGPRYTPDQAELDRLRMKAELLEVISKLPPQDWRERILGIEADVRVIRDNQQQIMVKLNHLAPS